MNNPPRVHHFVPQFWIKRYAAADGNVWAYDWERNRIEPRSPKALMQISNLYTVQPSGVDDTSLETVDLDEVDRKGNAAFDRVLGGDLCQDAKEELASFFSAQIMRDPDMVVSYNPKAQELTVSLLDIFSAPDYATFAHAWSNVYPGATITEKEYTHIRSLGLTGTEAALEKIIDALDQSGGLPELPFTDLVRSPDGRDNLRNKLLSLEWALKSSSNDTFVLGDTGIVYEPKALSEGLRAPLAKSAAIYVTASDGSPSPGIRAVSATKQNVDGLNYESAARSRRWIVGEPGLLQMLKTQVGSKKLAGP